MHQCGMVISRSAGFEIRAQSPIYHSPTTIHTSTVIICMHTLKWRFFKSRARSRAQTSRKKKALLKLALQKCFMTIGSTYKPRSVRSWLDEASKAIIGAIIHLDPTSPRGSSSLPETQEERAAPRPHKWALSLLGLAPGGGCLAADIAADAGGLLHHLFTLTSKRLAP